MHTEKLNAAVLKNVKWCDNSIWLRSEFVIFCSNILWASSCINKFYRRNHANIEEKQFYIYIYVFSCNQHTFLKTESRYFNKCLQMLFFLFLIGLPNNLFLGN